MSRNMLDLETSPYLLQHRTNPVHWRPWGATALAEAQRLNKPILLSVGYAACHWCHVMAHESFENDDTARLLNDLFLPIKVDREERPDIDLIYQTALSMLGQHGGWPLTMFLTPEGEPFWGGTYFPPTSRYGRPGFRDVLVGVATSFADRPDQIADNVFALREALARQARPAAGAEPSIPLLDKGALAILRAVDTRRGGLSGAPKFPQVPLFSLLWRAALRSGDEQLCRAVTLTLDQISQGGIYDHIGGGFARYSTDVVWLAPHFEKMLYDNAQMIELLTLVWQETRSPLYAMRVEETVAWLSREMIAEHGAFAATLDADSEGEEGKYYVWKESEIDGLLPAALAQRVKRTYGIAAAGNWEGTNILHRDPQAPLASAAEEAELAAARRILLAHRRTRAAPGRDDKILADWNGMMIAALTNAAFAFDRPAWLALARQAYAAVRQQMTRSDRLAHSLRRGRLQTEAMLDDYAQMARAALLLYEVTGDADCLAQAESWVAVTDRHYWDNSAAGYFYTADDSPDLILRTKSAHDNAIPSGNGVMVEVLARLACHTANPAYAQRARDAVAAFTGHLDDEFPGLATLLNAWELLSNATQLRVVGPHGAERQALFRAAAGVCLPLRVLIVGSSGETLSAGGPLTETPDASTVTAYLCTGPVCSAPVTDPIALRDALKSS